MTNPAQEFQGRKFSKALPRRFYERPTLEVARNLLGQYLCRRVGSRILAGRIVEVEAYLGSQDPASHTFRGLTPRNAVMFGKGGCLYVYFSYGMHYCANVVTERQGVGTAVLLRALEPVQGLEVMRKNRFGDPQRDVPPFLLCNGPGNLCKAFGITREANGTDLLGRTIWIASGSSHTERMKKSTRVGVTKGVARRWRFFLDGNPSVSRGRPST